MPKIMGYMKNTNIDSDELEPPDYYGNLKFIKVQFG